jgi:hypothetical protein
MGSGDVPCSPLARTLSRFRPNPLLLKIFTCPATLRLRSPSTLPVPQAITTLCYSSDGHTLLTGGDDAVVSAWLLLDVLDSSRSQTQPGKAIQPFHSW